ncbi:GTPase family protein [Jeongeupia chitinilytica]|uniref:HSR1-like GTP-binding protein n=1 Tax=Jeongeupia chitinilytica TaxID=1041641 RepID=A0ABQ3GWV9_9NEIS|nr:GTPase [Jeongeupia chitinilytica]GHD58447.1 HSR1-like GTP-binding protein [Jeongeupia chitinilytica]
MEQQITHEQLIKEIGEKINKIRAYTPRVGVFGNSGVGKSSLCNALFGKDVAKISDVEACTREPQEILLGSENGGIILVDVPGIGEDPNHQKEYTSLYKSLAPELDLVLWAIKADDRNYASALDSYQEVFSSNETVPPVLFVITQTDKTNDTDDWNHQEYKPGGTQIGNIAIKENDVSRRFGVTAKQIISVAASSKKGKAYNLKELVDLVVEALPNEKKYSFTREAKQENVSEEARKSAEKGIWDSVKDLAGEAFDAVKEKVADVIIASAPKILATVGKWIKSWF